MTKSVLLVEEEERIAVALQFLLERDGYVVRRAANADEARHALKTEIPSVVLVDVMTPGGGGYELCQEIRSDAAMAEVKVVMLTASGGEMARRKSAALGADGLLAKPFENVAVQGMVSNLVDGRAF